MLFRSNVNEAVSGVKAELSIKIYGDDVQQLQTLAEQAVALLQHVPGAVDVGTEDLIGQPQVQIAIDRAAIDSAAAAVILERWFAGEGERGA